MVTLNATESTATTAIDGAGGANSGRLQIGTSAANGVNGLSLTNSTIKNVGEKQ